MKNTKKKYSDIHSFLKDFGTSEQCYSYLIELKWSKGYSCRKCGHNVCVKGRKWSYRKCQICKYDESCTAHTLFHNIKFPITKAFLMIHQITTLKKGMSTHDLARQHAIHQNTAWFFKRKVQEMMTINGRLTLDGSVEVDETVVGGAEAGAQGRSDGKKKKVMVALQIEYPEEEERPVIKAASAEVIENYSAEQLEKAINNTVDQDALITTDAWSAYPKAVGQRDHLVFHSSELSNFADLHWYIFNLKNWIKGAHHHVSKEHMKRYLNEFNYRFNNRNYSGDGFIRGIKFMMKTPYLPRQMAVGE
jgi:transposase-like protein